MKKNSHPVGSCAGAFAHTGCRCRTARSNETEVDLGTDVSDGAGVTTAAPAAEPVAGEWVHRQVKSLKPGDRVQFVERIGMYPPRPGNSTDPHYEVLDVVKGLLDYRLHLKARNGAPEREPLRTQGWDEFATFRPTDPDLNADTAVVDGQEWHQVDSDDRYPGQFTSHVGERDGFRLRVDPGDNATYDADGFSWSASNGTHAYSGTAATRVEALREAVEAADYVTSGQAELDWLDDE